MEIDDPDVLKFELQKTPVMILSEYFNRTGTAGSHCLCATLTPHHAGVVTEDNCTCQTDPENAAKGTFTYTMKLGSMMGEGMGRNKKEAKQRAAQSLLKQLHPYVRTWRELELKYFSKRKSNSKYSDDDDEEGIFPAPSSLLALEGK